MFIILNRGFFFSELITSTRAQNKLYIFFMSVKICQMYGILYLYHKKRQNCLFFLKKIKKIKNVLCTQYNYI